MLCNGINTCSEKELTAFHQMYTKDYMRRMVAVLNQVKNDSGLILSFLDAFTRLFLLDEAHQHTYDARMGPGFLTAKSIFEECGGVEVIEHVQFNID